MKVFAKKFYGFNPETWPDISFRNVKTCDDPLAQFGPDDRFLIVGTKTIETEPEYRGRLLGYVTFRREVVRTEDHLEKGELADQKNYKDGKFRWPFAIPIERAWEFNKLPLIEEILDDPLPSESRFLPVEIDPKDAARILALPAKEIPVGGGRKG